MTLPYRTRRTLTTLGIVAMILVLIAIVVWAVWLLWLDRYVVYTRDGAVIDFNLSLEYPEGEIAKPPEQGDSVNIYFNEGDNAVNISTELTSLMGYYIDTKMLRDNFELVERQVKLLPEYAPVMIDLKDPEGYYYYSTSLGRVASGIDVTQVGDLLEYMLSHKIYVVARIPSFRDSLYVLDHDRQGLIHSSGRYVYRDPDKCYWLDPTNDSALAHLMQIVSEIKTLGVHEVVFDDFNYPNTSDIYFKGNRDQALAEAAQKLVNACMTNTFAISFTVQDAMFALPNGRTRIYMKNQSAGNAQTLCDMTGFEDPNIRLIFVTEVNDTRFDSYSVLRPITAAELEEED